MQPVLRTNGNSVRCKFSVKCKSETLGMGPNNLCFLKPPRWLWSVLGVEFKEERLKHAQGEDPALGTGWGREDAERGGCQKPNFCTVWKVWSVPPHVWIYWCVRSPLRFLGRVDSASSRSVCGGVTAARWRERPEPLASLKHLLRNVRFNAWPEGGSTLGPSLQPFWESGV